MKRFLHAFFSALVICITLAPAAKADTSQVLRFSAQFENATGEVIKSNDVNWSVSIKDIVVPVTPPTTGDSNTATSSSSTSTPTPKSAATQTGSASALTFSEDATTAQATPQVITNSTTSQLKTSSQTTSPATNSTTNATTLDHNVLYWLVFLVLLLILGLFYLKHHHSKIRHKAHSAPRWRLTPRKEVLASLLIVSVVGLYFTLRDRTTYRADTVVRPDNGKYVLSFGWGAPEFNDNRDASGNPIESPLELYLDKNITPFDGIIMTATTFHDNYGASPQSNTFDPSPVKDTPADYSYETAYAGVGAKWKKMTEDRNVLKHSLVSVYTSVGTAPSMADPDETKWNEILKHWRVAATAARDAGTEGIMLDAETYRARNADDVDNFDIPPVYEGINLRTAAPDILATEAKKIMDLTYTRGKQLGDILGETYGDKSVDLMLSHAAKSLATFGIIDFPWDGRNHYELLPAFVDGLVASAAAPNSNLHVYDGIEQAYYNNGDGTPPTTVLAQDTAMKSTALAASTAQYIGLGKTKTIQGSSDTVNSISFNLNYSGSDDTQYSDVMKGSFGRWLDTPIGHGTQNNPWYYIDPTDGLWHQEIQYTKAVPGHDANTYSNSLADGHTNAENYYSPAKLENSVRSGLALSDKYVWIYSQKVDVWQTRTHATVFGVPDAQYPLMPMGSDYVDALLRARDATIIKSISCSSSGDQSLVAGNDFTGSASPNITAGDSTVITTVEKVPAGLTWNANNKLIHWKPTSDQVGDSAIIWKISDGFSTANCSTTLHVAASAPTITTSIIDTDTVLYLDKPKTFHLVVRNSGNDAANNGHLQVYLPADWQISDPANATKVTDHFEIPLSALPNNQSLNISVTAQHVNK